MNYLGYALITIGLFLVISGSIGLLRFPDFFTRLHAASITDSLGAPLCILGLICIEGFTIVALKLVALMLILFLTCPTACHVIAKAAYKQRLDE